MCGRFVRYSHPQSYASQLGLDETCDSRPRFSIAPTQPVLAARQKTTAGARSYPCRCGLIAPRSKGPDARFRLPFSHKSP
jgi:putative SOS response-associated peptidase YedK